ncbi:MAG TPA: hypothetical protein DDW90_07205 [Cyanobacteria bacterium UBA9971]|nr:hypothetical protein [Cyanobacteria bacterium UBA9971]
MVEAVKNSTQIKNLPTYTAPCGTNLNAGRIENLDNESFFNQDLASPISGYGSDLGDLSNNLGSEFLDLDNMNLSMYGPIALNKRVFESYKQQMRQSGYDYENQSITEEDQNNLQPLSDRLDEYRAFGIRIHHNAEVTENLEESKKSGIGVALYLTNCAKDGLKDPNQPISFENLKNPTRLVNKLMPVSLTAPQANKDVNLLSDIAIKERSPEMAAALLEATSKGGMLGIGVDSETAKKLLVDSKDKFDSKEDYYKYITNIDKAYKKMFPGKSLDKYIKGNYKPTWQKLAPTGGVAAGALTGFVASGFNPLGAVVGAVVGGAVGLATYASNWFGKNEEGSKLMATINKARQNSHDVDIKKYTFGELSVPGLESAIPVLN